MRNLENVTVLLPVFEEEAALPKVIDEIREAMPECDIVAAYTPGRDCTCDILMWKKVEWITDVRRGKGNAVQRAFEFLRARPCVVMLDSDYTYPAKHIPEMVKALENADVVMGYRDTKEQGSMTRTNAFGNWALSALASILYGKRVYDVCTGMWAFRGEVLDSLEITSPGFTLEAELFARCARSGYRIKQIPICYRRRLGGSTPKLKVEDGFRIGQRLLKERFQGRRKVVGGQIERETGLES